MGPILAHIIKLAVATEAVPAHYRMVSIGETVARSHNFDTP